MADDQLAGIGWGGEFWLSDGAATPVLKELVQVKSFTLPQDEVEQVETSHLKSPGRRREYAPGMIEGGEFEVVLNFRAGSDTDQLLAEALVEGGNREFKAVIPERGIPVWDIEGECIIAGYDRGEVNIDDAMEATVTCKITGLPIEGAHVVVGDDEVRQPQEAAKEARAEKEKAAKEAAKKAAA
jgi:hypothetical protein